MPKETTDFGELKRVIEDIGRTFEEYKGENDARLEALGAGDESKAAEISSKLSKMDGHLTKLLKLKTDIEIDRKNLTDRVEELESRRNQPGSTVIDKLNNEHKATFEKWIRGKGRDYQAEQKLQELEQRMAVESKAHPERKDVTIGTPSAGGFAVPEQIGREIERLERKFSPVRDLVKVVQSSTSDYKELVDLKGATSGWVGETDARTATNTGTLRERAPTHGELYAYPQVSEWSLNDIFFNVEQWIQDSVAESFAIDLGTAVISGNGSKKPTGMLNTAPTAIPDAFPPVRSAESYESVSTANFSPSDITGDGLIDLVYEVNSRYRVGASFAMNSISAGHIRKLKDTTGQYLWQVSLQLDQPDRLLGYPLAIWEQMSDPGSGNFPIAFGNFRRGYLLVDIVGLRMTRDEVTNPGYVRFYVRRRIGGIILNNDAVKFLKID